MTAAVKNDTIEIARACDAVWKVIQKNHPDVPNVAITIGSGVTGKKLNWGHFHSNIWERNGEPVHELFIGGEGLRRGASELLATLLHEAAHGIAQTRKIRETSRQGRFHNAKFKSIAEELGLELQHDSSIGWSVTTVPEATQKKYAPQIKKLDGVLGIYRRIVMGTPTRKSNNNGITMECLCGRKIRIAKTVAAVGPIYCGVCDEPFAGPEEEEE
jgi:hypothetical protein